VRGSVDGIYSAILHAVKYWRYSQLLAGFTMIAQQILLMRDDAWMICPCNPLRECIVLVVAHVATRDLNNMFRQQIPLVSGAASEEGGASFYPRRMLFIIVKWRLVSNLCTGAGLSWSVFGAMPWPLYPSFG